MPRATYCGLLCVLLSGSGLTVFGQQDEFRSQVRSTPPLTPAGELAKLRVPDGFRVTLFASEPQIHKPMNMAFDGRGRLWVSGSNEYPYPAAEGEGKDTIVVLEDTDGDGRADRHTVFADDLNIPIGLYPYRDGVVVFSIPHIWFLRDTDGDGRCDTRRILYGPFDYSRDTHGLNNAFRRGFDGWLYCCHGFNNHSRVSGADGHEVEMQSGNTYRIRLDGSRIEQFTWGQVNPFGATFDAWGDRYTSDCHSKPVYLLLRDGYYPSFGKPHDGLGFVPPLMTHTHGSTALAGVMQYTGQAFPDAYRDDLFVGNVLTSRVHRDSIVRSGGSVRLKEESDFLVSEDPWFRPVDIQSGPDGALYVADFYNRIIGHYEVPLDHPGRDRQRGRIWRIDYPAGKQPARQNLANADISGLIEASGHSSLPHRMRALDEISDRVGRSARTALHESLPETSGVRRVQVLWALSRLGDLADEELTNAIRHEQAIVRVHALRIAAERELLPETLQDTVRSALADPQGIVRRAAAETIGQHADSRNLPVLFQAIGAARNDPHLQHGLRIALRNQLQDPAVLAGVDAVGLSDTEARVLAGVAVAVDRPEAGPLLLSLVTREAVDPAVAIVALRRAARSIESARVDELVESVVERFRDDPDTQSELLGSVLDGLAEQGVAPPPSVRKWSAELVTQLVASVEVDRLHWFSDGTGGAAALPWGLETRNLSDSSIPRTFISSLPGGEQATGILRSRPFALPLKLRFHICGHLGPPDKPAAERNLVRLRLQSGRIVASVLAPRNDTARPVTWDLSEYTGQTGYLEIVDGLKMRAYAWVAAGQFSPPVVSVPRTAPGVFSKRLAGAMSLVARLRLTGHAPLMRRLAVAQTISFEARAAAMSALNRLKPDFRVAVLAALVADPTTRPDVREHCAKLVADQTESAFEEQVRRSLGEAIAGQQQRLATVLAGSSDGAAYLLSLLEKGTVSPRLLQSQQLRQQLTAHPGIERLEERVDALVAAAPPAQEEIAAVIAERLKGFRNAQPSSSRGRAVYDKNCAACHRIGLLGSLVGPQLDGIGNRGAHRLLEDILDPHRNVDVAFRITTYVLESGEIINGLYRRDEGDTVIVADDKGKERALPRADIDIEKKSPLSLMSDNWRSQLDERDLFDLLAFLLTLRQS